MGFHSRDLRYFVVVVGEGGFSRVAECLFVSQPMLSRQVARLERDLRVQLLEHEPRHVWPTSVGEVLPGHARRMLADWMLCHGEMLHLDSGLRSVLFVGQQTRIGRDLVRHLISRLGQSCPGWRIELRQTSWEDPSAGVWSGQTDVGFVQLPVAVTSDMEHVVTAEEPIVLTVPEGHELTDRSSLCFAETATLPLIALPEQVDDLWDFWLADHARREPAPVALVAHTLDEALEAVVAGLEAVLLSLGDSVVHAHPGVVFIPVPDLPPARLAPVRRAGGDREAATEAFRAVRTDGALSQRTGM